MRVGKSISQLLMTSSKPFQWTKPRNAFNALFEVRAAEPLSAINSVHRMTVWSSRNPQSPLHPQTGDPQRRPKPHPHQTQGNHPASSPFHHDMSSLLLGSQFCCRNSSLIQTPFPAKARSLPLTGGPGDIWSHQSPETAFHPEISAVQKVIPLFLAWPGVSAMLL